MEVPVKKAFSRYQLLWSAIWRDVVNVVLGAIEEHNNVTFKTRDVIVHTDNIVEIDLEDMSSLLDSVTASAEKGLFDEEEARNVTRKLVQTSMVSLGISEVTNILPDEDESVELGEVAVTDNYRTSLRSATYGLWSGKLSYAEFDVAMQSTIDRGLRTAWKKALDQFGMSLADITPDEQLVLSQAILEEMGHIGSFGDYILTRNKASGGLLRDLASRMELWVNRYRDVFNRATVMVGKNEKEEWIYGDTIKHCKTCSSLKGKVKRAFQWGAFYEATGIRPQSPSLSCNGFKCECSLKPTTKKMSMGRLPIRK